MRSVYRRELSAIKSLWTGNANIRGAAGHLMLTHTLLQQILKPGDTVIDATAGNGHDSSYIAPRVLTVSTGSLICMDVQERALENTNLKLMTSLLNLYSPADVKFIMENRVQLILQNHRSFPKFLADASVAAIVYNLGYLPGSDKTVRTKSDDTIESLVNATKLLKVGGIITVCAYRGHHGGLEETNAVHEYFSSLDASLWSVFSHYPLNRPISPVLFSLYKL